MCAAAVAFAVFAYLVISGDRHTAAARLTNDIGLTVFSGFACLVAVAAYRANRGRRRRIWLPLAIGMAGWVVGNLILLYHHAVLGAPPPFPSVADAAFLLLPCTVVIASIWAVRADRMSALRPLLDGVIIASALFLVCWVLVLEDLFASTNSSWVVTAVSVAFPISDVVMVTLAVLTVSSTVPGGRQAIVLVCTGLIIVAVADSIWIYVLAQSNSTSPVAVVCWAAGLLLFSAGALIDARKPSSARARNRQPLADPLLWLPYSPLVAAVVVGLIDLWPMTSDKPVLIAASVLVMAALVRQLIVLIQNRRLLFDLAAQTRRDPLTGLGNRLMFNDHLDAAIQSRVDDQLPVAVLALDLDDFKMVNDNLGHPSGDELLIDVASRLKSTVPAEHTVARLGGDEFAVLIRSGPQSATTIAETIIEAFDAPFSLNSEKVFIHPSVGLAIAPADESDVTADDLLQQADIALYAAKRTGIGGVQTFSADMRQVSALDLPQRWSDSGRVRLPASPGVQLLGQLRRAISDSELKLVYQPKVLLATGEIVGVEALLRWPHPELGLLTPSEFLPLIRRNGLIGSVTDTVLKQAIQDASTWFGAGYRNVPVAINLFAPSLTDVDLADRIGAILAQHALPASALTVEITEQMLLSNMSRTEVVIDRLRKSGLRVSIDDFGSGYSTMSYLRDLPVDELKLDQEFVLPMMHSPRAAAIVQSVINLTHALNIVSVAEGVEDAATARQLSAYGCDIGQGFYFAKPMFAESLRTLIDSRNPQRP
ncbi:bifunctional diguanylate cyclase/phosphodiesterase [Mycolicibacterium sp. CBMA 226]|uniref:putative bifunctional diguanylate cyclase/phosphodiesterase n=1 Tax=Mycolicibacterium sp. CBMA 226 TaxID=2606611 RepID=UPI0012DF12D7|nr:GGDEF domain-containing phosphodiesterase [Mycolicibacterium sp. CBMA 226]MUL77321.1 EAL domain-containing protein [Mycolicibacterium sp. CBMA 226]